MGTRIEAQCCPLNWIIVRTIWLNWNVYLWCCYDRGQKRYVVAYYYIEVCCIVFLRGTDYPLFRHTRIVILPEDDIIWQGFWKVHSNMPSRTGQMISCHKVSYPPLCQNYKVCYWFQSINHNIFNITKQTCLTNHQW